MRLCPERPLPPYSYVPGRSPHPLRDPAGHSYGRAAEPIEPPSETTWESCEPYLFGLDLFNHGYYWEAHEEWEAVWHACGRQGTIATFFKGLIKLAAAGVKAREGIPSGVQRHLQRGAMLLEEVASAIQPQRLLFGLPLDTLATKIRRLAATAKVIVDTSDRPAVDVMRLDLYPSNSNR